MLCYMYFHYENLPKYVQPLMEKEFMKHRDEVADVFNKYIHGVNASWKLTGKPFSFGKYAEDVNPKYVKFVKQVIQPHIDVLNEKFPVCKYKIDNVGDLVGYSPFFKNSKIWFTLKEIES